MEDNRNSSRSGNGDSHSNIGRRSILRVGASAVAAPTIGGVVTGAEETEIVTARSGPASPEETATVPVKWHNHNQSIWEVHNEIGAGMAELPFVSDVFLGRAEQTIGGLGYIQYVIEVLESATEEQRDQLPDDLEETGADIPDDLVVSSIRIEETSGEVEALTCSGQFSTDPYHGGLMLNGQGVGTSGYRMTDGSNEYMLTANHVVASGCNLDTGFTPETITGDDIGPVQDGHKIHDWALFGVDQSSGITDISNKIWYDGNYITSVDGYKTQSGLNQMIGQNGQVWKQGQVTGFHKGVLRGIGSWARGPNDCIRMDGAGVRAEVESGAGDSGGPLWDQDSGGAYVISQISIGVEDTNNYICNTELDKYAVGWPTYKIVNNNPYYI